MPFSAHYNDRPEYGEFGAEYETKTPNCKPYYTLKFGPDLRIFIEPDRLQELSHVINTALTLRSGDAKASEATA